MKPKDIFGIVIRTVGLYALALGVPMVVISLSAVVTLRSFETFQVTTILSGVLYLIIGFYFLRGAPWIVRYAYPHE
jgi:hypothetical protein